VPIYPTADTMFTTIRCKIHVTNRQWVAREEAMQSRFFNFLEQNSSAIGGNSSSAIRRRSA